MTYEHQDHDPLCACDDCALHRLEILPAPAAALPRWRSSGAQIIDEQGHIVCSIAAANHPMPATRNRAARNIKLILAAPDAPAVMRGLVGCNIWNKDELRVAMDAMRAWLARVDA
jgi:hypothetical protein